MYNKVEAWLNDILGQKIPSAVRAFCFNLYDDWNEGWSIELVGTENFDVDDEDWACDEITDFGTRFEKQLSWKEEADWNEVLSEVSSALKQYLENGLYADILKSRAGVAVGFVDGNLEILYSNLSGTTQELPILTPELEYDEKIARQNIEANGETLDRDFVSSCIPEVHDEVRSLQNEMSRTEKSTAAPQPQGFHSGSGIGEQSADMRKVAIFIIAIILIMSLFWVLGLINDSNKTVFEDTPQQTEQFSEVSEELHASVPVEVEEETSMPPEPKETELAQIQLQVYIQPDMPEPFAEMLGQLEEVINLVVQDPNGEGVWEKTGAPGRDLREMLQNAYNSWWIPIYDGEEMDARYSLTDLTGDGFPELIMGRYHDYDGSTSPKAVCYYNKTDGIEMIYWSDYFPMALYEGGIIEFSGGGVNHTIDYIQFQEDNKEWINTSFLVVTVIDGERVQGGANYYRRDDEGDFLYDGDVYEQISEEEYKRITDKYTQKPMELEWTQFVFRSESTN